MKREDVLELKIIDTLITEDGIDYIICKLSQNTEVLKRGLNTEYSKSFEYPGWDIRNKQLYTSGAIKKYDNLPFAVPTSDIELLKEKIFETMKALKAKKIETPTGAFTIKNNPASLIIDDKNLIPARFIKIEQVDKIEKAEIKKAIKNGEKIAGVHLETSQSLLIR